MRNAGRCTADHGHNMSLQSSGSGQQRDRRRRHHHHHHHHNSASSSSQQASTSTRTTTADEAVTLAEPTNGHEVTVRYSQSNGVEMNGYSRRGKSQSPEVTSWVQVPNSVRNGSINGQAWRLGKVFNENDEALINRKLPKELLLRIFSHLDVVSLCRCAQVKLASKLFSFSVFMCFYRSQRRGTFWP